MASRAVWLVRSAMLLVVAAAVLAWLAVGELADAESARSSVPAETIALAESTAELGEQVQAALGAMVTATGSAADAMTQAVAIAENVRVILDALPDVPDAEVIAGDLGNAEASLLEAHGGLTESHDALDALQSDLDTTVAAVGGLVDQVPAAGSPASDAHNTLARIAILAAAAGLLLALAAISRMTEAAG